MLKKYWINHSWLFLCMSTYSKESRNFWNNPCVYQKKAVPLRAELLGSFLLSRESDRKNTNPPAPERDQAEGRSQPLLGGYGQGRYFVG